MTTKEAVKQLYKAREAIDVLLAAYEKRESGCTKPAKKQTPAKRFTPPQMIEWIEYGKTLSPPFDHLHCGSAFDHYCKVGWMVGRNRMKDWKAACRQCHKSWIAKTPGVALKSDSSLSGLHQRLEVFKAKHQGPHSSYWDFLSEAEKAECTEIIGKIKEFENK